jgi:hypothetical protein
MKYLYAGGIAFANYSQTLPIAIRQWFAPMPQNYLQEEVFRLVGDQTIYLDVNRRVPPRFNVGLAVKPSPGYMGQWLLRARGEKLPAYDKYEGLLSKHLPHVRGVTISPGPSDFRLGLDEGAPGYTPPPEGWSSGTSHLSMVLEAFSGLPTGSIVLIEEPELSLHPGAIRRLRDEIHRLVDEEAIQFFLTTHSPVLVEGLDPAQKDHALWQFKRNADGSASATRCETEEEIEGAINSLLVN